MSGHSRSPEIRRRRARKEKITHLRRRLASATAEADKKRIIDKLHRLSLASPGNPLV